MKDFFSELDDRNFDVMEQAIEKGKRKFKPAENLRYITPRSCAFCKHLHMASGFVVCDRPDGFRGDAGDMIYYEMVCDRFEHNP